MTRFFRGSLLFWFSWLVCRVEAWTIVAANPKGSAATPVQKKKVAVFGAGGYLGATTFGFLQRASSLYGTGLGGASSPRCICATAVGSKTLNGVLSKSFVLGFAGEDSVRLTNMQNIDHIATSLKGYHAVIVGTAYQLETRPVTGNTYETSPNDKTLEFFLDKVYNGRDDVNDDETHKLLFRNTLMACQKANIQHVVVIETPMTIHNNHNNMDSYAKALDDAGIPFTYIRCECPDLVNTPDYTYYKGIQSDLKITSFTLASNYKSEIAAPGDWINSLPDLDTTNGNNIPREDIAALAVQVLQSVDWTRSRCLQVSSAGPLSEVPVVAGKGVDRLWCANSELLANKLAPVQ